MGPRAREVIKIAFKRRILVVFLFSVLADLRDMAEERTNEIGLKVSFGLGLVWLIEHPTADSRFSFTIF